MSPSTTDQIRAAAGIAIQSLIQRVGSSMLKWRDIDQGFIADGKKIHFATKAAGIFRPKELSDGAALSIKLVQPSRKGREAPYDDGIIKDGRVVYQLQRGGKESHFNLLLEEARNNRVPLIFFCGVADGIYNATYPVFVESLSYPLGQAVIVFDKPPPQAVITTSVVNDSIEASYGVGPRKIRLHQQAFRQLVLGAYGLRCALTNLPLVDLLEAAHIIRDSDGGEASVRNGIAMSTFHHTAYEADLMGIDPDGKIHLSDRITAVRDGPMYDHGLLRLEGLNMRFPLHEEHMPNRDFLALKFEQFKQRR